MPRLGYTRHHEGPAFIQFNAPGLEEFPLDLMLVNKSTFDKLWSDAVAAPGWPAVKVVSLMNLLALKCHAVKHGHPGRVIKDADDVIRLIQNNRLDLESEEMRALFHRHGTEESYDEPAPKADPKELDFPDWSGMDESSFRISPEAALRLCEAYPRLAAAARAGQGVERSQPCPVELVL